MTSLIEHAEAELRALPGRRDGERIMLERDVVALVALFDAQRHSGSSARFVTGALKKLLWWKKLDAAEDDTGATEIERQRDLFAGTLKNLLVVMEAHEALPHMQKSIRYVLSINGIDPDRKTSK